jgi:hypothetical protein
MLTESEIADISGALSDVVALNNGRSYFAQIFNGPEFNKALSAVAPDFASHEAVAAAAIKVCVDREWTDQPSWLERLLLAIQNQGGAGGAKTVADLGRIIQRIHNDENILDSVWYDHWLRDKAPFVGRSAFRKVMARFPRTTARPMLRVEGASKTGKSYSRELLEWASEKSGGAFQVVYIEISEATAFTMNSIWLTQRIVSQMGGSPALKESGEENPSQDDMAVLLDWIWRVGSDTRNGGKKFWIFLDGLRFLQARNSARKLVHALAEQIGNGNYRQRFRLILGDFDETLVRVDEDTRVTYDRPTAAAADASEVEECLKQLNVLAGHKIPAQEIQVRAQAIVAALKAQTYFTDLYKLLVRVRAENLSDV